MTQGVLIWTICNDRAITLNGANYSTVALTKCVFHEFLFYIYNMHNQ